MNRQEAKDTLYDIGMTLAEEMGLTQIKTEDLDCGFWDMGIIKLSDHLKSKYGEMKTVIFHNGIKVKTEYSERWEKRVELGYRFSNPQICVFGRTERGEETLAKIELSDSELLDGSYVHTDEYRFSEGMFWKPEGYEMQMRLMKMWADRGGR